MIVQTVVTVDGTVTLFVRELNEHYHSVHGAKQESVHVFIKAGLEMVAAGKNEISIFELGFGTGLNALLTYQFAEKNNCKIDYCSVEKFPLEDKIIETLNYAEENEKPVFKNLHNCEWNKREFISDFFSLEKIKGSAEEINFAGRKFDLIYFDAFAPGVQPELWTDEIFKKMFDSLNANGLLVTYCAKGEVRRAMKRTGFTVEKLPGPPGKREMTRGRKIVIGQ